MSQPLDYIFIDTCTFQQRGFFNQTGEVKKLFDLAEKGYLRIIMPAVTEHEWRKHFFENARFNFTDIKKKTDTLGIPDTATFLTKISGLPSDYDRLTQKAFQTHMDRAKVIRLKVDYPYDQLVKIFEKYFAQQKPFGPKKSKEFPDAFVLASLEKYAKENRLDRIVVFSSDKDMTEYASDVLVPGILVDFLNDLNITRIPQFTKQQQIKAEHDTSCLRAYIDSQPMTLDIQIRTKLEEFLNDPEVYMERLDYTDIEGIDIEDLEFQLDCSQLEFTSIDDETITASVPVNVNAYVKVSHFDQENSIWDSEDKEYLIKNKTTTDFELSSECRLNLIYSRPEELIENQEVYEDAVEIVGLDCSSLQEIINERYKRPDRLKDDGYLDWERIIEGQEKSAQMYKPIYPFGKFMNPFRDHVYRPILPPKPEILRTVEKMQADIARLKGKR